MVLHKRTTQTTATKHMQYSIVQIILFNVSQGKPLDDYAKTFSRAAFDILTNVAVDSKNSTGIPWTHPIITGQSNIITPN